MKFGTMGTENLQFLGVYNLLPYFLGLKGFLGDPKVVGTINDLCWIIPNLPTFAPNQWLGWKIRGAEFLVEVPLLGEDADDGCELDVWWVIILAYLLFTGFAICPLLGKWL